MNDRIFPLAHDLKEALSEMIKKTPNKEEAFNPSEITNADVRYSKDEIIQRIMYIGDDGKRHTEFRRLYTEEDIWMKLQPAINQLTQFKKNPLTPKQIEEFVNKRQP